MSEPTTPLDSEWRRLHPLSPLLRGGLVAVVTIGIVIANLRDWVVELFLGWNNEVSVDGFEVYGPETEIVEFLVDGGLVFVALGAVLLLIIMTIVLAWVSWRFATFRVTHEAVEERSGVIFRKHRRAPLDRIQGVNLQRPLIARMLGLTKVDVLTAGQGGKVDLTYLGFRDAKAVREQILQRVSEKRVQDSAEHGDTLSSNIAVGFDNRDLGPAHDRLTERAHDFIDVDVDREALEHQQLVTVPVGRLIGSIALSWEMFWSLTVIITIVVLGIVITPAILFGALVGILVMITIPISMFNRGFHFTLSRGRDSVRTGAGLTATKTETIPFGRIHAIEALQPLFWRPLGWWKVRITVAGHSVAQGGQNGSGNIVLPVGTEAEVVRVIDSLLPGVADDEQEVADVVDGLTGPATSWLKPGRGAGILLWFGRRRAAYTVHDLGGAEPTIRIRRGALTRSLIIMPIVRAQSIQMHRPLVHRALGLASLQAHTVLGPVMVRARGLALADAQASFDRLANTVVEVQAAEGARETNRDQDRS